MPSASELFPWIIIIAAAAASFIAGILCLIRFAKTRQPFFLVLGLLLTFLVPGALLYLGTQYWSTQVVTPPDPIMVYGPLPSTDLP
jgi:hypothetical protein